LIERRSRRAKRFYEKLSEGKKGVVLEAARLIGISDTDEWVEGVRMW